jgi:hypothetical protein
MRDKVQIFNHPSIFLATQWKSNTWIRYVNVWGGGGGKFLIFLNIKNIIFTPTKEFSERRSLFEMIFFLNPYIFLLPIWIMSRNLPNIIISFWNLAFKKQFIKIETKKKLPKIWQQCKLSHQKQGCLILKEGCYVYSTNTWNALHIYFTKMWFHQKP